MEFSVLRPKQFTYSKEENNIQPVDVKTLF